MGQEEKRIAIPFLTGIEDTTCKRLLEASVVRSYRRGELLLEEGTSCDRLFVLRSGIVELFARRGRRDASLFIYWPPATLPVATALSSGPCLFSARALTPVDAIWFDAQLVRTETKGSAALAMRFNSILADQLRISLCHLKDLKLRSGPRRLGAFLLQLIDETGFAGCADLPIRKATLAARLNIAPATLSRAFCLLREHGLEVRGTRLILVDRERFERFCRPDELIDGNETQLAAVVSPTSNSATAS